MPAEFLKWFIEQAEKRGYGVALFWVVGLLLIASAISGFLGWLIGKRTAIAHLSKAGGEAERVHLENRTKEGELLSTLNRLRETWQAATDTLNLHFVAVRDAVGASVVEPIGFINAHTVRQFEGALASLSHRRHDRVPVCGPGRHCCEDEQVGVTFQYLALHSFILCLALLGVL